MAKEIFYSDEARNKLYDGVKKLSDAVKVTMGPRGRNVLIQKSFGAPSITKDGVSVAKEVELKDTLENMGASLVREVASKTADQAGDGTTTATVLAHAIFKEGLRNITAGANPIEVKRGMDKACEAIIAELKALAKPVAGNRKQIAQVATISANSDTKIGELIADAMEKVGKDGVITVEEAKSINDELNVVEGMQFDRGYLSPYFITNADKMVCELSNPLVLILNCKLENLYNIVHLLEEAQKTQRSVLIIADDFDNEVITTLAINKTRNILNIFAIKTPGFGEYKKHLTEDLAIMLDAKVYNPDDGVILNSIDNSYFGSSENIIITKNNTTIVNGAGSKDAISARINQIKAQIAETTSDYDREKLQERLAKLSGGVAVIKVGAATETEMKEKKDRVDDALSATKAAVEEGIVIGGGAALIHATNRINLNLEGDELIGANIVRRAIKAPIRQIAENAGFDAGVIVNTIETCKDENKGFDAASGEYVDMYEAGIIDPVKVERVALLNAVSVASMLLTTEATISDIKE